ncbi:MAG: glycoside hydrolase family 5 protein [Clostridium sp.]|nr:glycoside hydrolase family 5 protein [Clostridium sp.]
MKKRTWGSLLGVLLLTVSLVCTACGGNAGGNEDSNAARTEEQENGGEVLDGSDGAGGTAGDTGSADDGITGIGADEAAGAAGGTNATDEAAGEAGNPDGAVDVSALQAQMGFRVDGRTLLDANGNPFVMRGVNHAHTWFADQLGTALKAIQGTGSNAVRIVLSDGAQWTKTDAQTVANILAICKNLGMVAIFEVHDATGYNDVDSLLQAAEYFVEIKDVLIGEEEYCIINIANEWGGDWNSTRWCEGYTQAIPMLREAGLAHTIMVDACGWGQYGKCIGDHGREVLESDILGNTMFSVHMYGTAGGTEESIDENMGYALDQDLCLVIGEFGYNHSDGDVQEDYIMARCVELNVGYLAWSWKGNGGGVEYLDLADDWNGNSLSEDWGEVAVNGPNGIRETAVPCTVFTQE